MSYLLDKQNKRKKLYQIATGVFILLLLFYFRASISKGVSSLSIGIFRPVLIMGNGIATKWSTLGGYLSSKNSLSLQNQSLQEKLRESEAQMVNYNSLLADNASLKEILSRKDAKIDMIAAAILEKPNQSAYDTLVIDAGSLSGVKVGDTAFALGNVPIGRVAEIYPNSAKIILFTNTGERTQASIQGKNIFTEIVGRGGGNFEMIMPKDFTIQKGDQVLLPGINSYVLAIAQAIISDPRHPYTKALLVSPVNIQELKFVEVLK